AADHPAVGPCGGVRDCQPAEHRVRIPHVQPPARQVLVPWRAPGRRVPRHHVE
ncbi:unnamed protein product, partial [Prorocentrum cordatum]